MKKILILGAVLPIVGIGIGYGAGLQMKDPEAKAAEVAAADTHEPAPQPNLFDDAAEKAPQPAKKKEVLHLASVHKYSGKEEALIETDVEDAKDSKNVVQLGSMMVPVYKAKSVTYVVADFGVSMPDSTSAAHYRIAENSARLRDKILVSFREAAENSRMKRAAIDSDWLSEKITDNVRSEFKEAQEVLFLSLYKKDVPRS